MALDEQRFTFDSGSKVCKAGDNKKRRQLNQLMSEILLEGNSNLNFEPVVAHKTSELVESYRSPEKNHMPSYYNAVTLKHIL